MAPLVSASDDLDQPFWDGLSRGELRVQRCTACGRWTWKPQWRCGQCGSWRMEWPAVAPQGVVYSWTRTHQAFSPAMRGATPFTTVLAELPQAGGVRLLGNLTGPAEGVRIGATVEAAFEPSAAGAVLRWRLTQP